MARTYTPAEALKVHGRVARSSGTAVADQWLTAKGFGRLLGEARRQAAITEAGAPAARTAKKARKARKAQEAARIARISRMVTEALAASSAPPPPPGTGMAPAQGAGEEGLYSTMSAGRESPFWQLPAAGADVAAEPPRPLHDMTTDEFRAYAAGAFNAHGRAHGLRSPSWEG